MADSKLVTVNSDAECIRKESARPHSLSHFVNSKLIYLIDLLFC